MLSGLPGRVMVSRRALQRTPQAICSGSRGSSPPVFQADCGAAAGRMSRSLVRRCRCRRGELRDDRGLRTTNGKIFKISFDNKRFENAIAFLLD